MDGMDGIDTVNAWQTMPGHPDCLARSYPGFLLCHCCVSSGLGLGLFLCHCCVSSGSWSWS